MGVLTVVTWCHYMKRCKLNTSYSCGARGLMVLMRWGRTVYIFPVTTYIWRKGYTSINTVCSISSAKQANSMIPAGTSYLMRWRAVCSLSWPPLNFSVWLLIRSSQRLLWDGLQLEMFLSIFGGWSENLAEGQRAQSNRIQKVLEMTDRLHLFINASRLCERHWVWHSFIKKII